MLIGIMALMFLLLPFGGKLIHNVPTWLLVIAAIIVGINLIRVVLSLLFGKHAAEVFTGRFLYDTFLAIIRGIGNILRVIFRIR